MTVCRLCLTFFETESSSQLQTYTHDLGTSIRNIFPQFRLNLSQQPLFCYKCIQTLVTIQKFQECCIQKDKVIREYYSDYPHGLVDIQSIATLYSDKNCEGTACVCRLCLKFVSEEDAVAFGSHFDVIQLLNTFFGEIDLYISPKPVICKTCIDLMKQMDDFVKKCQNAQNILEEYSKQHNIESLKNTDLAFLAVKPDRKSNNLEKTLNIQLLSKLSEDSDNSYSIKIEEQIDDDNPALQQERLSISSDNGYSLKIEAQTGICKVEFKEVQLCDAAPSLDQIKEPIKTEEIIIKDENEETSILLNKACESNRGRKKKIRIRKEKKTKVQKKTVSKCICYYCGKEYTLKQSLMRHIRREHNEYIEIDLYKCHLCKFETCVEKNFNRHALTVHSNKEKNHKCSECSYSTPIASYLQEHIKYTHKVCVKMFDCPQCEFRTVKNSRLVKHLAKHRLTYCDKEKIYKSLEKVEPKIHKCPYCKCESLHRSYIARHINWKHNIENNELFKCDFCSYQTNIRNYLTKHRQKQHLKKLIKCDECSFETKSKWSYHYHIKEHRGECNTLYHCSKCDFKSSGKHILKNHTERKHGLDANIEIYRCLNCNFETVRKSGLVTHIKWMHPSSSSTSNDGSFKCKRCSFQTSRKTYLTRHMIHVHGAVSN